MKGVTFAGAVLVLVGLGASLPFERFPLDLHQGWTDNERRFFYATTQGSRMLSSEWFRALERVGSRELFADGLVRYEFLRSPFDGPDT